MPRYRMKLRLSAALAVCAAVVLALLVGGATAGASGPAPLAGSPAPAALVGLYAARFSIGDEQTAGTWHLRVGPGHHLKVWNVQDRVANTPSFEAGPVSFRGHLMVFARETAEGVCGVPATYSWTMRAGLLSFRVVGRDFCEPRFITFTPHYWRRVSA